MFSGGCDELFSLKGIAAALFLFFCIWYVYHAKNKQPFCGGKEQHCTCSDNETMQSQPDPRDIARADVLSAVAAGY